MFMFRSVGALERQTTKIAITKRAKNKEKQQLDSEVIWVPEETKPVH